MVSGGGGKSKSRDRFPSYLQAPLEYMFSGKLPTKGEGSSGQGVFADMMSGYQNLSGNQAFGGLADQIPGAQQAGSNARDMAAEATGQAYGNTMDIARRGFGPMEQASQIAGLAPQGLEAATYYMDKGVTPAVQGGNIIGASGAGQQVVDAALGASTSFGPEMYKRVVAEGLPEVRASYSARGLGTGGEAARGEQDYISRTRDMLSQQEVQNRIAAMGVAANASGAAASQAIGAQNAAIGRGGLAQQAAEGIPGILGGLTDVSGKPLGFMSILAALQGLPIEQAQQGLGLYGEGLRLPLAYQQALYQFTRDPQESILGALGSLKQNKSSSYNGQGGVSGGSKGGGGGSN